jgi:hypothetical protein
MLCRSRATCELQLQNHAGIGLTRFFQSGGKKRLIKSLTSAELIAMIMDTFSDRHETEVVKRL